MAKRAQSLAAAYTEAEVLEFNRRHDRYYGWTPEYPQLYFNQGRLPETVTVADPGSCEKKVVDESVGV